MKNRFNDFNCGGRSLTDEVREGPRNPPNTAVVSENIGAVHKLIMPDRHVTYRKIKASIHPILREQLAVRKICSRWIPLEKKIYVY